MSGNTDSGPGEMRSIRIGIFSPIAEDALAYLADNFDCAVSFDPPAGVKREILKDSEIVILRSPVRLDEQDLRSAKCLRLIVRAGAGLDSIDVEYAERSGIEVVAVPLSGRSVAEHVFGLILSLYRGIPFFYGSMREGRWEKHERPGFELYGKTIGLVGLGRIGRCVAELAIGFGMRILACDRSPEKKEKQKAIHRYHIEVVEPTELFERSDIISVQVPLNDQTRLMVDGTLMGLMAKHSILINVGRGHVVDEDALYSVLSNGRIMGAALDVYAGEPVHGHPLLELENFIGTPHVGAQTVEAQRRVAMDLIEVISKYTVQRSGS
jgi:phosphoglycerate dehydrogenase-like enzyme